MFSSLPNLIALIAWYEMGEQAVHFYNKCGSKAEDILRDAYFGEDREHPDELTVSLILE